MNISRLEKLLSMKQENPEDHFIYHAIGMEYKGADKLSEAESSFRESIHKFPEASASYYQLALILIDTGRVSEAIEILNKGLSSLSGTKDQKSIREFRSLLDELEY